MTAPVAAAAGGGLARFFVSVAPSMAGVVDGFKKNGADWGIAASQGFLSTTGQFAQIAASVGTRTASEFSDAMSQALNRMAPDLSGMFTGATSSMLEVTEGIFTFGGALEKLPGKMGEIGAIWGETVGTMVDVAKPLIDIGGMIIDQYAEVGERWREIQRDLLASTAQTETALGVYKDMVRDIAGSGRFVDINDISASIGKIGERMGWRENAEQLKEFTTRYGEAVQLLQSPLDIEQITGLFKGFNVSAEEASEQFTQLINLMAETGRAPTQFLTSLDRLQGSARRIGLELPQLGQMLKGFSEFGINEEYITEGMNTLTGNLAQVAEKTGETVGEVWDRVIAEGKRRYQELYDKGMVEEAQKALVAMMTDMTGSSMVANALSEGIMKGVVDVRSEMEGLGDGYNRSLTEAVEKSLTMSQIMGELGNRILVSLEPVGDALLSEFQGFGETVSKFFEENNLQIMDMSFKVFDVILSGTQTLVEVTGNALKASAGTIEGIIDITIEGMQAVLLTAEAITKVGSLIPGQVGRDFADTNKSLNELRTGFLENVQQFDIEQSLKGFGDTALSVVPAIEQFRERVGNAREGVMSYAKMTEAAKQSTVHLGEEVAAVQAVDGTKEFKITGDIDTFKIGMEQAGIIFEETQEGVVTGISAANDIVAQKFEDWYKKNTGRELQMEIDILDPKKNVLDALGIPRSQQVTDSEGRLSISLDLSSGSGMMGLPGMVPFGSPSTLGAPGILRDHLPGVTTGPQGQTAAAWIAQLFPRITDIGGSGARPKAPGTHDAGMAIDVMMPRDSSGNLDMQYGDAINAWLKMNAQQLGIKYIIWRQTMQNMVDGSSYLMKDLGNITENHMDHIDIQFNGRPVQGPALAPTAAAVPVPSPGAVQGLGQQMSGMPSWMTPEMQAALAKAGFSPNSYAASPETLAALGIGGAPSAPAPAPAPAPSAPAAPAPVDAKLQSDWDLATEGWQRMSAEGRQTAIKQGRYTQEGVPILNGKPYPQRPGSAAAPAPGGLVPSAPSSGLPESLTSHLPERPNPSLLPQPTPTAPMQLSGDYDADRRAFELQGKQDRIANTEESIKNLEGEIAKSRREFAEAQSTVADLERAAQGLQGTDVDQRLADARERELNTYSTLENRLNALQDAYDANAKAQTEYELSLLKATKANEDAALKADKNAEALGKGLVSGILEGLGLDGSVFSDPTQWGIWKLFAGGINYAGGLADSIGKGEKGAAKPQGTDMLGGLLGGMMPGSNSLLKPGGQHWTPGGSPGPGNAMAPTQSPSTPANALTMPNVTTFQINSPLTDGQAVNDVVERAQMQNFNASRAPALTTTTSGPMP